MDVAIVKSKECFYSREAEKLIRGFFDKLMTEDKQKMEVTLKSYDLKDLDHNTDRVVIHSAKVQIVIISHHFLQRLKDEASRRPRLSPINRVFKSKNVIAVLHLVTARDVLEAHESVLPRFSEWFSVDLRSTNKIDPEFCKKFTEQVVRIYNVELSNSSNFSVFPKKVTREQPKIAIVFKKPIEQSDEVRIELKTGKQTTPISNVKLENPHTILQRIPESLSPDREAIVEICVFINNKKVGGSRIKSELNMRHMDEDQVDRMAKVLPSFLDWLDNHIAETLMKHYRDCTDYTTDPELELMNGIIICKGDILPTIMHFAAYYGLRKTAYTVLQADGLPHCNARNELDDTPADIANARGHSEIAQLLTDFQEISHYHAAYQYIKDVMPVNDGTDENIDTNHSESDLQEGDELDSATEETTNDKMTAIDNDDASKDITISSKSDTQDYSLDSQSSDEAPKREDEEPAEEQKVPTPSTRRAKTHQTPNRHIYVNDDEKQNPEVVEWREGCVNKDKQKRLSIVPPVYDIPRGIGKEYQMPPPELRPVTKPFTNDATNPVLKPKNTSLPVTDSGYIIINETNEAEEFTNDAITASASQKTEQTEHPQEKTETSINDIRQIANAIKAKANPNGNVPLDTADEQLIALINHFKDKTYDIKVVELLFENWKQRPDVQESIEMKMKMLDKLRDEYKKIQHQQTKGSKKTIIDKIKMPFTSKRKKSAHSSGAASRELSESINGLTSPTAQVTFTGPCLPSPSQVVSTETSLKSSMSPPYNHNITDMSRVSESSYRTSIDSRASDSSVESDKPSSESSLNSNSKAPVPLPPEYNNPMNDRFISSYVYPNPQPQKTSDSAENGSLGSAQSPPVAGALDLSYQVPPPPRPVKPSKKTPDGEHKISPSVHRKPPVIPEEQIQKPLMFTNPAATPPAIPAKPKPKYTDNEAMSPPPVPPPRNQNNAPNMFNYVDYKQKNQEPSQGSPSLNKKSYENMGAQ